MASSDTAGADKITTPYGSWKSPITAEVVAGAGKSLDGFAIAGDGRLVWIETRPEEEGRAVLVKEPANLEDEPIEVIPVVFAARTLAQEYGGGAFAISKDLLIFSNYEDQRLYKQSLGVLFADRAPVPITLDYDGPIVCYADGVFDHHFNRYITIMEDRRQNSLKPSTSIVAIEINDRHIQEPKVLVEGNDFYAFPRIDNCRKRMAWIEWRHPNMPWDCAELWVGYFSETGADWELFFVINCVDINNS